MSVIVHHYGSWGINEIDGSYYVFGNKHMAAAEFRKIHRMPPNEYGNFFGREKAGYAACKEIIELKKNDEV